jgi:hypothetical protein
MAYYHPLRTPIIFTRYSTVSMFCALFSLKAKAKLVTSIGVQPFGCAMLHYTHMSDAELFFA